MSRIVGHLCSVPDRYYPDDGSLGSIEESMTTDEDFTILAQNDGVRLYKLESGVRTDDL